LSSQAANALDPRAAARRTIRIDERPESASAGAVTCTLADLGAFDCQIGDLVPGGEVIATFRRHPSMSGAVVHDGERTLGVVSRTGLFGALGQRFGMEVFLKRPVGSMLEVLQSSSLCLPAGIPVEEGMRAVLARPPDEVYEPLLIVFPGELGRVLDVHVLMLAQDRQLSAARHEAQRQRDAAHAAAEAKGRFLANMSHEMRTPLNGILGVTELLVGTDLDPDQAELLDTLRGSAELLLELIGDVLDSAKLDSDAVMVHPRPVALGSLCGEVLRMVAPRARAKGLALDRHLAPDLPPLLVTDPLRLRQILLNLLGNAVKFTATGSVALEVTRVEGGSRPTVRFAVGDTGIGIPVGKQRAVFEPFVQADETTTRRYGGTGLGLTISRALVKLLGGDLAVESVEGQGSTFSFELPLNVPPLAAAASESVPALAVPTSEPAPARADLRSVRVLLAEDNPVNQKIATRLLERLGAEVTVVGDGDEAVTAVAAARPAFHVVLMDVQMPKVDGLQALAAIRAAEGTSVPRLPIVALTAHALAGDRERLLAAGMDGYLAKPVVLARLLQELGRVLGDQA
jgi:signal transduction histidine kinase/CheY-like chemotaxis protein